MLQCGLCLTGGSIRSFGLARARYDFSARDRTELSLREGDTIKILKKGQTGWWKGEVYGRVRLARRHQHDDKTFKYWETILSYLFLLLLPGGVVSIQLCGGGLLWLLLRCSECQTFFVSDCIKPNAWVWSCVCERKCDSAAGCPMMWIKLFIQLVSSVSLIH